MQLDLPWPPKELRPNANSPGNWRKKSEAAKRYKRDCLILALAVKDKKTIEGWTELKITFHPPDNKRRDLDNMLAQIKQGIDAIAQAWKTDDRFFRPIKIDFGSPVKHGKVLIEF